MDLVSFIMPTHGRAARQLHIINDCIYWWTQQTWPNKELVILNDVDGQTLTCSVPGVRVYNVPRASISSLGYKMNALMDLARGEIICPWEDDDLYLPWRAEQAVKMLDGYDFWNPKMWGYHYLGTPVKPDIHHNGLGHANSCCWRRTPFLNSYPDITTAHDQYIIRWAEANQRCNKKLMTDIKDISYFYSWNKSDFHLSGLPDMEWSYRNTPTGPLGNYELKAVQHTDLMGLYDQMVKTHATSS